MEYEYVIRILNKGWKDNVKYCYGCAVTSTYTARPWTTHLYRRKWYIDVSKIGQFTDIFHNYLTENIFLNTVTTSYDNICVCIFRQQWPDSLCGDSSRWTTYQTLFSHWCHPIDPCRTRLEEARLGSCKICWFFTGEFYSKNINFGNIYLKCYTSSYKQKSGIIGSIV